MTSSSRHRVSRRARKKKPRRMRNVILVTVLFLAVSLVAVLAVPAPGIAGDIQSFLYAKLGCLSILLPLFLFQTGAWLLDFKFRKTGFRILSGIAVTGYFFATVLDFVISRRIAGFHNIPGGSIAGTLGDILVPVTGTVITFLILFTAFVASLVAFTGWDISSDFQLIADRFSKLISGNVGKKKRKKRKIDESEGSNVWSRDESNGSVPDIPFIVSDDVQPDRNGKTAGNVRYKKPENVRKKISPESLTGGTKTYAATDTVDIDGYIPPPLSCLDLPDENARVRMTEETLEDLADLLMEKLEDFGIDCKVTGSYPGPVITRFEVEPGPGIKVNKFVSLSDDLALALKARRIRILAPIPGKGAVGIEVPNPTPETVFLREVMYEVSQEKLPIALGKKIEGKPFVADITTMPHLLIAGATGSGKSVCMHSIIASLLLTKTPSEVRLAMIDPKMLELSIYEGIPHLWAPVVIETDKATGLLEALVSEMENRYKRLSRIGVRSIDEFNSRLTLESEDERLPYIVVFIDELTDLMLTVSREIEPAISRLAHMARAVGIHMVLATQRPSVDVITGVIKANFPSRIAFNVQSKTDSRTILDMNGAEKLLGKGDMLFLPTTSPEPVRIHGSFISTEETRTIVEHLRDQPEVPFEFEFPDDDNWNIGDPYVVKIDDPLFGKAKQVVVHTQQGSVSIIQRRLRVGYSRAASLIDMLEQAGVVGPFQGSKARAVLITPEELEGANSDEE
ncbi:MAG: DNA translocase FtsK [Candidatus Aegiribacteria sp.]|nr:DNA translocase FtsK [Candidatus Aegiribacteria sp.]